MIQSVRLQNFRSYIDDSFEFNSGVNIIVGPNASGKTNIIEALLVASTGSSYRASDNELIRINQPWARLDVQNDQERRTLKIKRDVNNTKRSYEIGSKVFVRLPAAQRVPVILFEPNHLRFLHGSPELRRQLIDDIIEQIDPDFAPLKRRYVRTLSQRNALLKQHNSARDQLFAWNVRLSDLAGQIVTKRLDIINICNKRVTKLYQTLSHNQKASVVLHYQSPCDTKHYGDAYLRLLEKQQDLDIARGFTGSGPHRDDIRIVLNGFPAAHTASRGEARSAALTIKICELQLLEEASHQKPLLLLDDVFSELDGARRRALTEVIKGYQTVITTTDADVVVQHFMDNCHIIPLS